jgi:hypothetical protein
MRPTMGSHYEGTGGTASTEFRVFQIWPFLNRFARAARVNDFETLAR